MPGDPWKGPAGVVVRTPWHRLGLDGEGHSVAEVAWTVCRGCYCGGQPGASYTAGNCKEACDVQSGAHSGQGDAEKGQMRAPGTRLWQLNVQCHFSWLYGPKQPSLGTFLAAVGFCVFVHPAHYVSLLG